MAVSAPSFDSVGDQPELAVDERATVAGTGAGDVYVVVTAFDFKTQTNSISLVACTNLLNCGRIVALSGSDRALKICKRESQFSAPGAWMFASPV